jgi:hypothetical protein
MVAHRLWQLDLLSRWLEREGLPAGELTVECAEAFLAARRAAGYATWRSARSTALPLEYLRELGVVAGAPGPMVVDDPLERLLAGYCRYLLVERGLLAGSVFGRYEPAARLFSTGRVGPDGCGLERLGGSDVRLFFAAECPKRSVSAARDLTCALRSLLRYLYLTGVIPNPLVWAVPAVADLRDRSLPRGLDRAAVRRLLASALDQGLPEPPVIQVLMRNDDALEVGHTPAESGERPFELRLGGWEQGSGVEQRQRIVLDQEDVDAPHLPRRRERDAPDIWRHLHHIGPDGARSGRYGSRHARTTPPTRRRTSAAALMVGSSGCPRAMSVMSVAPAS